MTKYEYLTVKQIVYPSIHELDALGEEGWLLVSATPEPKPLMFNPHILVFVREKQCQT